MYYMAQVVREPVWPIKLDQASLRSVTQSRIRFTIANILDANVLAAADATGFAGLLKKNSKASTFEYCTSLREAWSRDAQRRYDRIMSLQEKEGGS